MKNPRLTRIAGQLPNLIDPYNGDLLRSNQGYCFLFGVLLGDLRSKTTGGEISAADVKKIPPRDCVKTSGKFSGGHHATFTRLHASCSRFRDVSVDSIALQHGGESV